METEATSENATTAPAQQRLALSVKDGFAE